jgi:hypothetical protein
MKLTSENVNKVIMNCLFDGEPTLKEKEKAIMVEGVVGSYGFDPQKIENHVDDISSMLKQLPSGFQEKTGGGWSFLNACDREDGIQWGEQRDVEALLVLGIAARWAKIQLPRKLWSSFPGGMPYFVVYDKRKDQ